MHLRATGVIQVHVAGILSQMHAAEGHLQLPRNRSTGPLLIFLCVYLGPSKEGNPANQPS